MDPELVGAIRGYCGCCNLGGADRRGHRGAIRRYIEIDSAFPTIRPRKDRWAGSAGSPSSYGTETCRGR